MREVLYIGKFLPTNLLKTAKADSKGKIGFSNHNFEISLIKGLQTQENVKTTFISVPGVFAYPKNNKRIWISSESYIDNGSQFKSVGFFNLTVLNRFCKMLSLFVCLVRFLSKSESKQLDVIVNTPANEILFPLHCIKLFTTKEIHTALIVPDIPAFVSGMDRMNPLKKFVINGLDNFAIYLASKCDSYVVLTEAMMDFFPAEKKHIVMEGIVDVLTMDVSKDNTVVNKNILYTGTLRKIFGVMNLVDAFEMANIPNVELRICGSGEASEEIKARASKNPLIKFYGLVDSKDALRLQREATVLVNPRTSEGEFTKYSFPSKTMEYLLSGNPVVANKLPGIPQEYDAVIQYPDNETVAGLADKLKEILSLSSMDLQSLGVRGREFVIKHKNSKAQMARVLEMLQDL